MVTSTRSVPADAAAQLGLSFEPPELPLRRVWAVGELIEDLRRRLERDFADVWVEGEITNLRPSPAGHVYFTLKDRDGQLPMVLFRRSAALLRFRPQDGLAVRARGRITVFEQRGQLQMVVELLETVGTGSLQLAFEQLKEKLLAEGLFAAERKRPLPAFPRTIGIVTSPLGAVIRDFLNIAGRRSTHLHVLLYPAAVQGEGAAAEIAAGIACLNGCEGVDVIVVARGGGSLEDMQAFNTERVARAIAASARPVVSAVGHETDFTIADFVADLRAPTPSAAAELLTEARHRIAGTVGEMERRLLRACRYRLMQKREQMAGSGFDSARARVHMLLSRRTQRVDECLFRLEAGLRECTRRLAEQLDAQRSRLDRQDVPRRLDRARHVLSSLEARLEASARGAPVPARARLGRAEAQLLSLSPLAVLDRGYAVVFDGEARVIKDAAMLAAGDPLRIRLARGEVRGRVITTTPGEQKKQA
jgi:exodeoxyribonuclease VII large subunit